MSRIFVDTWAWYALTDAGDQEHVVAQLALDELLDKGYTFVTTNFVLAETFTLIRYNLHHRAAVEFQRRLQQLVDSELVELIRIDKTHEDAAWLIFERYDDQDFSYTDCTSFAVMRTLKLIQAFTGDHHFAILGFTPFP